MEPIYLDHAATTPMRAEVLEAMEPFHRRAFGNPSSAHRWGREAQAALDRARGVVANALGAERREIVFVRGGTESDNLAVLGRGDAERAAGRSPCVVVSAIEHKAVLDAARAVEADGGRRIVLPVDRAGTVDLEALDAALDPAPCVVSIMWVNNEVGVVQPMGDIVARCRQRKAPVHTDAVQAVGKVRVRLDELDVDLLTLTGHKLHGPKSTGALFVRDGTRLSARIHGGGQEGGLRPGTQDVAGAIGLAEAVRLAVAEQEEARTRYLALRTRLLGRLRAEISGLRVHGEGGETAGHILSIGVPGVAPDMLTISLDMEGIAVSGGSACQTGASEVSHVLAAMRVDEAMHGDETTPGDETTAGDDPPPATVRFSFGRETTRDEIDAAAATTIRVVQRLRGAP